MKKTKFWKSGTALLLSLLLLAGLSATAFASGGGLPAGSSASATESSVVTDDGSVRQDDPVLPEDASVPQDSSAAADDSSVPQDSSASAGDASAPQDSSVPAEDASVPQDGSAPADDSSVPAEDSSVPQDDAAPANDASAPQDASLPEEDLTSDENLEDLAEEEQALVLEEEEPELALEEEEPELEPEADPQLWTGGAATVGPDGMKLYINGELKASGSSITINPEGTTKIKLTYTWTLTGDTKTINGGDWLFIDGGDIPANLPVSSLAGLSLQITTGTTLYKPGTTTPYKIGVITFERADTTDPWRAKLTFDAEVKGLTSVTGGYEVEAVIDVAKIKTPGETVIFDDLGGLEFEFDLPNTTDLSKKFVRSYMADKPGVDSQYKYDTLEWNVDVNTSLAKNVPAKVVDTLTRSNYNPNDTAPNNHTFTVGAEAKDIEVYRLKLESGQWVADGAALTRSGTANADAGSYKATIDSDRQVTIELGTISKAYRIVLRSHTDLTKNKGQDNGVTYYNYAAMQVGDKTYTGKASKWLSYAKWLTKKGKLVAATDSTPRYIEWAYTFNPTLLKLGTDVDFGDIIVYNEFPNYTTLTNNKLPGTSIDAAMLYKVASYNPSYTATDEANGTIYDTSTNLWGDTDHMSYTYVDANNFNLTFKSLDGQGYKLVLRTLIADDTIAEAFGVGNGIYKKDSTTTTWDDATTRADAWVTVPGDHGTMYGKKAAGDGKTGSTYAVDYVNQKMTWTIYGSTASYTTDGDTVITDTFVTPGTGYSMDLLTGSLKAYKGTPDAPGAALNYTLAYLDGKTDYTKGFKLTITDHFSGPFFITYDTTYTLKPVANTIGGYKGGNFKNTVSIVYGISSLGTSQKTHTDDATQTAPDKHATNAEKTSQVITNGDNVPTGIEWTIDFNFNRADLSDKVIYLADSFSPGMRFQGTASDLKVYKFVEQGGAYQQVAATPGSDYELVTNPQNSTHGFDMKLMNVKDRFLIVYTTTLDQTNGQPAHTKYTNTAVFKDAEGDNANTITVDNTVKMAGDANKLEKVGTEDGDYFRWTVTLNKSKKSIQNGLFTDTLSTGQLLLPDSIEVKNATNNITLQEGDGKDYKLTVQPRNPATQTTTFAITFLNTFDYKVEISYLSALDPATAQVNPNNQNQFLVSNSARFTGEDIASWTYTEQTTVAISGAGTGAGSTIPLRIEKYAQDGSTITVLDGAEFTLRSADGSYEHDGITTMNGKSALFNLLAGTYIIEETLVPDGYDKAPDQTVTLNENTPKEGGVVVVKFYNVPTQPDPDPDPDPTYSLVVLKRDADTGAALAGAQFEVLNSAGVSQGTIVIGSDGAGALATQLPAGTYTIVEAVAPAGYVLPANPNTTVQVPGTNAQNNVVTVTVTNQKPETPPDPDPEPDPTYTLTIVKRDAETSAALAGAKFTVMDKDGARMGAITTGSNGKGTLPKKLPAGTYTVVETEAPSGYQLPSNTKTTVKLPGANEKDGVVTITITNQKTPVTPSGDPDAPDPDPDPPAPPVRPVRPVVPPEPDPTPNENPPEAVIVPNTPATTQPTGGDPTPAEPEEPAPAPVIQDEGPDGVAMDGFMNIPLGGLGVSLAWSLLNLIMSILSLLAAIVLIISLVRRKKTNPDDTEDADAQLAQDDELEEEADEKPLRTRRLGLRLLAILTGFIPGVLFLILENIRLPMTWITRWTPIIGLFFIINMVALLLHFIITKRAAKNKPEDPDDDAAQPNYA